MSFDPTTFVLEMINFVVLVWLLKRLLYQPVLDIVERRRQAIEKELEQSRSLQTEASRLKEQYENRLQDWEKTKEAMSQQLSEDLKRTKEERLAELKLALERERESHAAVEKLRLKETNEKCEQAALLLGARFASKLLSQLVGKDTDQKLCDIALAQLSQADANLTRCIQEAIKGSNGSITVQSALPLKEENGAQLQDAFSRIAKSRVLLRFEEDPELIAGLSIDLGSIVLQANLKNELQFFTMDGDAYVSR